MAILGPEADTWSKEGLRRVPFHLEPWYVYDMWEGISQNGSSCDYINERVIQQAEMGAGKVSFGPMDYEVLILAGVKSLNLETVKKVLEFADSGGKLICIGSWPVRTLSMTELGENEELTEIIDQIQSFDLVYQLEEPKQGTSITDWITDVLDQTRVLPHVQIHTVDRSLYQILHQSNEQEILFITNTNRRRTIAASFTLETQQSGLWLWNPEDGSRIPIEDQDGKIELELKPLESYLIVADKKPSKGIESLAQSNTDPKAGTPIQTEWEGEFRPIRGELFHRRLTELFDFNEAADPLLQSFAGTVVYRGEFEIDEIDCLFLDLGQVNDGVTRVMINGQDLGVCWYGEHQFPIGEAVTSGRNTIEIEYTTLLWNYCRSLDLPETNRWIRGRDAIATGITGPIMLR